MRPAGGVATSREATNAPTATLLWRLTETSAGHGGRDDLPPAHDAALRAFGGDVYPAG